jgi:hypothetical protein
VVLVIDLSSLGRITAVHEPAEQLVEAIEAIWTRIRSRHPAPEYPLRGRIVRRVRRRYRAPAATKLAPLRVANTRMSPFSQHALIRLSTVVRRYA